MLTDESRLHLLERIVQTSLELTSEPSMERLLHQIVAAAVDLTGCESAGILLSDDSNSTLHFVAATNNTDQIFDIPVPVKGSFAGEVFESGVAEILHAAEKDPRHYTGVEQITGYLAHSLLAVPLRYKQSRIGVLEAENKVGEREFDQDDIQTLTSLAVQATIAIENARLIEALRKYQNHLEELVDERTTALAQSLSKAEELNRQLQLEIVARRQAEEELRRLAATDMLTGVYNRRYLFLLGEQAFTNAFRYNHDMAAILLDADHFKRINDTYGHAAGDEVLKLLAAYLRSAIRQADILARYGGEEFVILMPETDLDTGAEAALRLLEGVRGLSVETPAGQVAFTISLGVAACRPCAEQGLEQLINQADQAMYTAKQSGRNRVVAFQPAAGG